ncbi:MAG: hypothetical protein JXB14_03555 [Candidatus Altiarchaeota archaeon]|nr:hypothetical protein [Candidatus Altiarchaeota archaeon]
MDDTLIGKVVTMQKFVDELGRYGFRYSQVMNSMVLVAPYVPKEFRDCGVEIVFGPRTASNLVRIEDVRFTERSNPHYKKTEKPDPGFVGYVAKFLQPALQRSLPWHVIQRA